MVDSFENVSAFMQGLRPYLPYSGVDVAKVCVVTEGGVPSTPLASAVFGRMGAIDQATKTNNDIYESVSGVSNFFGLGQDHKVTFSDALRYCKIAAPFAMP